MASTRLVAIDGPRQSNSRPGSCPSAAMLFQVSDKKRKYEELLKQQFASQSNASGDEDLRSRNLRDMEWLEQYLLDSRLRKNPRISRNPIDLHHSCQIGNQKLQSASFNPMFATRHLVQQGLLQERLFDLQSYNKVFCSQWLNESQVVIGTKCNTLMILDLKSGKNVKLSCLKSSGTFTADMTPCGIHAIEINPSCTLLATGAEKPNELAVYKVPTFDAVCVGEGCHTDWIFDVKWLDDEYLLTGSRDSKLGLWKIDSDLLFSNETSSDDNNNVNNLSYIKCLESVSCEKEQKIRAVVFNQQEKDIVALTLNAKVHFFDSCTLMKKESKSLPTQQENVCLAHCTERNIYAIGSKSNLHLLDAKDLTFRTIESKQPQCGIRSISFSGDLLTIGTGAGGILFYDLRMMSYLDDIHRNTYACLSCSEGFVRHDEEYYEAFLSNMDYTPAIYTHKYDSTSTKLFVAGGPLPANITGNYAALWS